MTTYQDRPPQSRRAVRASERAEHPASPSGEPLDYSTQSRPPLPGYESAPTQGRRAAAPQPIDPPPAAPAAPSPSAGYSPAPAPAAPEEQRYRMRDYRPESEQAPAPASWSPAPAPQGADVDYRTQARPPAASSLADRLGRADEPGEQTLSRRELRALREQHEGAAPPAADRPAVSPLSEPSPRLDAALAEYDALTSGSLSQGRRGRRAVDPVEPEGTPDAAPRRVEPTAPAPEAPTAPAEPWAPAGSAAPSSRREASARRRAAEPAMPEAALPESPMPEPAATAEPQRFAAPPAIPEQQAPQPQAPQQQAPQSAAPQSWAPVDPPPHASWSAPSAPEQPAAASQPAEAPASWYSPAAPAEQTVAEPSVEAPASLYAPTAPAEPPVAAPLVASPQSAPPAEPVIVGSFEIPAPAAEIVVDPPAQPEADPSEPDATRRPSGHWTRQADLDDVHQASESTLTRRVGSAAGTTSSLVLPVQDLAGEGYLTGSIDLPASWTATGRSGRFDGADLDHLLDEDDHQVPSTDSVPISAIRAVSGHTGSTGIIGGKPKGNKAIGALIAAASGMAVVVVGLLVVAVMTDVFA